MTTTSTEAPALDRRSLWRGLPLGRSLSGAALVAVGLVAVTLRFADISGAGYWHDEIFTVDLVRLPFERMLRGVASTEGTPPAYYVLAWLWARLFGTTEAGLRSLSALAGVLTVLPVYLAGRLLFSIRVGIAAAVLVATSPVLVWYGQEARSYSVGVLAVASSFAAVALATRRGPSAGSIAFWAASSLVAVATHYFTVFAIVGEALWLVWLSRNRARRLVLAACFAVAVEIGALVPLVLAQRGNPTWIAASGFLRRALDVPSELLAGPQPSVGLLAIPILALSLAALAIVARGERAARAKAAATLGIGAAVVVVPLLLVGLGIDFFVARNLVFATPFLFVATAAAVGSSRLGLLIVGTILAFNVFIVAATAGQPKYGREDWRSAARALGEARAPRAIVLSPSEGENAFRYYRPLARVIQHAAVRVAEVDVVALPPASHRIGRNPVPPRPTTIPKLAGFHLAGEIVGSDYTILRLRARRVTTVTAQRLTALALEASASLLVEKGASRA